MAYKNAIDILEEGIVTANDKRNRYIVRDEPEMAAHCEDRIAEYDAAIKVLHLAAYDEAHPETK